MFVITSLGDGDHPGPPPGPPPGVPPRVAKTSTSYIEQPKDMEPEAQAEDIAAQEQPDYASDEEGAPGF